MACGYCCEESYQMTINFKQNHNNKLNSPYIFTIRKYDNKFIDGMKYKILLNHKYLFEAKIVNYQIDYFYNVKSLSFYLDCEKNYSDAKKLFYSFGFTDEDKVILLVLKKEEP
jgi:hypothetical protein